MKKKTLAGLVIAVLISGVAFAQNAAGRAGKGYGGPPQSQAERTARQAACSEKNAGLCPRDGNGTNCPASSMSRGKGKGHGLRDGTGPRNAGNSCPAKK